MLNWYNKLGFDLVPIQRNGKIPIEKDWTNKNHKEKAEWDIWLKEGLNIGLKTGKISNVTILDIDKKEIPKEIVELIGKPLIQESTKGYHLVYQYEPDLRKTSLRNIKKPELGFPIDIENDGGQVVICPSVINKIARKWLNFNSPTKMSPELKKFLLSNMSKTVAPIVITQEEKLDEEIKTEDFNISIIKEGNRHNVFMHLGGIMRKMLNVDQTKFDHAIISL